MEESKKSENKPNTESKIIKFPAESIIVREGEENTDMYKILQGHAVYSQCSRNRH